MDFALKHNSAEKARSGCQVIFVSQPRKLSANGQRVDKANKGKLGALLKRGDMDTVIDGFSDYARDGVVEMGGRAIATMLGATRAAATDKGKLAAAQFGDYAQSSGSGNANIVISDPDTLAALS